MKTVIVLSLMFAAANVFANPQDALKQVPQKQLDGITILGCESKEPQSTVSCRSTGKCTITIVTGRVSCKGVRK